MTDQNILIFQIWQLAFLRYLCSSRTIFYFASRIIYDDVLIFCCSSQYILSIFTYFILIFLYLINRLSGRTLFYIFVYICWDRKKEITSYLFNLISKHSTKSFTRKLTMFHRVRYVLRYFLWHQLLNRIKWI